MSFKRYLLATFLCSSHCFSHILLSAHSESKRMMKSAILASILSTAVAFAPANSGSKTSALHETKADLVALAEKSNPVLGFYDPLGLADKSFWDQGEEATIGFLRHAELKHGRIAMAAFVGYIVQSNFHFTWPQTLAGDLPPSLDLSPEAQWDAIPQYAKVQIFLLIGILELFDENGGGGQLPHCMSGRKPGEYPTFQPFRDDVHFIFDLYDPFGFTKKRSEEDKAKGRIVELNNGRLAMIGIFGFLAEDHLPGSVPGLLGGVGLKGYDGNCMIPFSSEFSWFS